MSAGPALVRTSCAWVMTTQPLQHVSVDMTRVELLAQELHPCLSGKGIQWDEEGWHYSGSNEERRLRAILLVDTLNFCFWPCSDWEYERLASAIRNAAVDFDESGCGPDPLDPQWWSVLNEADLEKMLGGQLPDMQERARLVREVGASISGTWTCNVSNMIRAAGGSACQLVDIVTSSFSGFRDSCIYRGRQIFLLKRAQIFVADVWGMLNGKGLGAFDDMHMLTMFADYRVPQMLRDAGVMVYSDKLAAIVDAGTELLAGSEEETQIRCATVHAVELLTQALKEKGGSVISVQVDWLLWQKGEGQRLTLRPHHRTKTIFY